MAVCMAETAVCVGVLPRFETTVTLTPALPAVATRLRRRRAQETGATSTAPVARSVTLAMRSEAAGSPSAPAMLVRMAFETDGTRTFAAVTVTPPPLPLSTKETARITSATGVVDGERDGEGVEDREAVVDGVTVAESDGVEVAVGVTVPVAEGVGVCVGEGVGDGDADGVCVEVCEAVGVSSGGEADGEMDGELDGVGVAGAQM